MVFIDFRLALEEMQGNSEPYLVQGAIRIPQLE
jgi:hypothetical protein